jgi:A/G-specific adenine glycosylase
MAQQTQIGRVVERFGPFMQRFPTPAALAAAEEQEVLAAWKGMGYYRRARLLKAAAGAIVRDHGGSVPGTAEGLRRLPGVGRYTAGAVASIALGQHEPIVDGNVARVLMRVHGRPGRTDEPGTVAWCWTRAGELVRQASDPAAFNEGVMELGATVCLPRGPRCGECPMAGECVARRRGVQDEIPEPKRRAATPTVWAAVLAATDEDGRVLVERREGGMWAGMWQLPTLEAEARTAGAALRRWAGGPVGRVRLRLEHQTSHRLFVFEIRRVEVRGARAAALGTGRRWARFDEAEALPMSSAQRRIVLDVLSPRSGARVLPEALPEGQASGSGQ